MDRLTLMECPDCKATLWLKGIRLTCTGDCGWYKDLEGIYHYHVDGKKYETDKVEINKSEVISKLDYFKGGWSLFQEFFVSDHPDIFIHESAVLNLKDNPVYLYTVPPSIKG